MVRFRYTGEKETNLLHQWDDFLFNGTYSRYGFLVGEFPSPGLAAGRTDRPLVRLCIVSGRVGEEERLFSGEKTRIKAFLT